MGKKKYFCDFCSRYFNDDKNTKAKHMSSFSHMKAKSEHYDLFKDPETVLMENLAKKPCRKFQTKGDCPYGNFCTYRHYSDYDLNVLRQEVEKSKFEKTYANVPSTEVFCQKYEEIVMKKSMKNKTASWSHELPTAMISIPYILPPSIYPFNFKEYENLELEEWG